MNCVAPGMIDLGEKAAAAFMKKMARQTPMKKRPGRGNCGGGSIFRDRAQVYYRADTGCGWGIGSVGSICCRQ